MTARPCNILIVQDNEQFGGHEIMLLRFLPAMLDDPAIGHVTFAYPAANQALGDRLRALASPRLSLIPTRWTRRRAEPYLAPFRLGYRRAIRALYDRVRPDTVLLVQGRIENCVVPTLALPSSAFIVSYIPMAHGMAEIGRARFGDRVRRRLYRRPDRFIVPSASIAAQLSSAGSRAPAVIVPNVIDVLPAQDRNTARRALALSADDRVALFLGRFDVAQKGLDTLAAAIRRDADALRGWTFLFVGRGEGQALIATLARELSGRVDIRLHDFADRPQDIMAAADLLLLPSRWEGVPLVMLEAMAHGLPILASGVDIFTEHLPQANRCNFDGDSLARALDKTLSEQSRTTYADRARAVREGMNQERSARLFVSALHPSGPER